jgi:multiple sugar transport system substrate-binding protein
MKLKKIVALVVSAVMVTSLAACGNDSGKEKGGDGNKTITFWSVFTGGDGTAMQKIIDAYNATNPEYTVEHIMTEQGELYTKLPLVVNSQSGVPDLCIQHVDRLPSNAKSNMYLPLDNYISSNGKIKADQYVDSAWNMGAVDGSRYGIPLDLHSYVTYYNKDLVEKYCSNVLDDGMITFDEIAGFADQTAADGVYTYAITWPRYELLSWYYQLGGKLTEDGKMPSFNNDLFQKVFRDFANAIAKKWCTQDGDQPNNLFAQGKLMFLPEGTWTLSTVEYTGINFGETYMITYDTNNMLQWASSHQFVIPRNDKMTDEKANAIMDFIAFVGENCYEWADYGQIPASKAVLSDSRVNDLPQKFLIDNPDALVISDYIYYGAVVEALDTVAYEIPFGRVKPADGLQSAQQLVEDNIKNQ